MTWSNENRNIYYMAKPVLSKSVRSDWFFLGRDFAVQTNGLSRVFLFWRKAGKLKICKQKSEKTCEYCHSSQRNQQKILFYF